MLNIRGGLVAFPNSEKKEKETFCCVFLKNVLRVSNPNLFYQRKSFSLFGKEMKKCHSLESLFCLFMWKCSLDLDVQRVNFLSHRTQIIVFI